MFCFLSNGLAGLRGVDPMSLGAQASGAQRQQSVMAMTLPPHGRTGDGQVAFVRGSVTCPGALCATVFISAH